MESKNNDTAYEKGSGRGIIKAMQGILLLLLIVLYVTVPMYAWFYQGRRAAGLAEISDPTAIYINAANKEDIRYMDLSGIDVEKGGTALGETGKKYKDFVFCVRGSNVPSYRIQLAYTTNNQFEYELYRATLADGAVPANDGFAIYTTHPLDGTAGVEQTYYIPEGATKLQGAYKNRDTESDEILALDDDIWYRNTYAALPENDPATTYNYENKYAIPIYWQTTALIRPGHVDPTDIYENFYDYFILRVIWDAEDWNSKETDIIYIAAKNTSTVE